APYFGRSKPAFMRMTWRYFTRSPWSPFLRPTMSSSIPPVEAPGSLLKVPFLTSAYALLPGQLVEMKSRCPFTVPETPYSDISHMGRRRTTSICSDLVSSECPQDRVLE